MRRPHRLAAIAVLLGLFLPAAVSAAIVPASGRLDFTVLRNGAPIGTHVLKFSDQGPRISVAIHTDIAVKIPVIGIALYRFEHTGNEVWNNDRLVKLWSETNDNGVAKHVSAAASGGGLQVNGSAKTWQTAGPVMPASLWNPHLVQQGTLLNTLDGSRMAVSVRFAGEENVQAHGATVRARHYVVDGELKRELWYDKDWRLVMVRFTADDDSDIRYILQ